MKKQIATEYLKKIAIAFEDMTIEEIIITSEAILATAQERRELMPPFRLAAGFDAAGPNTSFSGSSRVTKNHLTAVK